MAVTEIDVFGIYFFGIYVSEELWFDIVRMHDKIYSLFSDKRAPFYTSVP